MNFFKGHAVGGAITGAFGSRSEPAEQMQQQQPVYAQQQQQPSTENPCGFQLKQFLECAQNQHDITLCQGFNEALRECRVSYGEPFTYNYTPCTLAPIVTISI